VEEASECSNMLFIWRHQLELFLEVDVGQPVSEVVRNEARKDNESGEARPRMETKGDWSQTRDSYGRVSEYRVCQLAIQGM
jgi:hypothetical protein